LTSGVRHNRIPPISWIDSCQAAFPRCILLCLSVWIVLSLPTHAVISRTDRPAGARQRLFAIPATVHILPTPFPVEVQRQFRSNSPPHLSPTRCTSFPPSIQPYSLPTLTSRVCQILKKPTVSQDTVGSGRVDLWPLTLTSSINSAS
jgi:hypothetical protein